MTASLSNSKNPMGVVAPTGGITALSFKLIGGILYFCPVAIAAAATGQGYWKNHTVRGAPKVTGTAWIAGTKLYWDNSAAKFTTVATGNTLRGFAAEIAASADATGVVELNQVAG